MSGLTFKIAENNREFEAIHVLNYRTFVEEIPQHPINSEGRLVDAYHDENTYAICLDGDRVVGMLAGRGQRPFSLDRKLADLANHLPPHHKPVEVRLLAVEPAYRKSDVFARLVALLAERFAGDGYDLALISGTLRQLRLYAHLGFTPFGPRVGTAEAPYQPMYLDLDAFHRLAPRLAQLPPGRTQINLLPGPVGISKSVATAFHQPPVSHRDAHFMRMYRETREALCALTGAREAVLLTGSGTLANEAVAAQISRWPGRGLILANGEFGERLVDHARRWGLDFDVHQRSWGAAFDLGVVEQMLHIQPDIRWLWAVACETSTGVLNPADSLADLCASSGIDLCLDAISAIGSVPISLKGVRLASCVSGKALGAYPGLSIVLNNGPIAGAGQLPRYLDLADYQEADGVPFTLSSNLLSALHTALTETDWASKLVRIARTSGRLRKRLRDQGFSIVAADEQATPAVITLALPASLNSHRLCRRMQRAGYRLAHESAYLATRNWIQACLMGEFSGDEVLALPKLLTLQAGGLLRQEFFRPQPIERAPCSSSSGKDCDWRNSR